MRHKGEVMNRSGLKSVITKVVEGCNIFNAHYNTILLLLSLVREADLITEQDYQTVLNLLLSIQGGCEALKVVKRALDLFDV